MLAYQQLSEASQPQRSQYANAESLKPLWMSWYANVRPQDSQVPVSVFAIDDCPTSELSGEFMSPEPWRRYLTASALWPAKLMPLVLGVTFHL